jgi:branched-chain amino acid transport system ATP-binding protein
MVVETQMPVLRVEEVELAFGGVKALNNVSITINQGELVSIIGPNGAGKTCLANCICGFYKPQKGKVIFKGRDVTRFPVYSRTQIGIGRTFQGAQLFGGSVLDNIMTGRHLLLRPGIISSLLYFGKAQRKEIRERMYAEELLHFLDLEPEKG